MENVHSRHHSTLRSALRPTLRTIAVTALTLCVSVGASACSPRSPHAPWQTSPSSDQSSSIPSAQRKATNQQNQQSGSESTNEKSAGNMSGTINAWSTFTSARECAQKARAMQLSAVTLPFSAHASSSPSTASAVSASQLFHHRLLVEGLTSLALSCPVQGAHAAFTLARVSEPSLPSQSALSSLARAMSQITTTRDHAKQIAISFDHEAFVERFVRLSATSYAEEDMPDQSPAATHGEETLATNISDIFAQPFLNRHERDPREKIDSTASLTAQSLTRRRTDPASHLTAPARSILLMDEARAAAASLSPLIASHSKNVTIATKKAAIAFVAACAHRAYAAGYPLTWPSA